MHFKIKCTIRQKERHILVKTSLNATQSLFPLCFPHSWYVKGRVRHIDPMPRHESCHSTTLELRLSLQHQRWDDSFISLSGALKGKLSRRKKDSRLIGYRKWPGQKMHTSWLGFQSCTYTYVHTHMYTHRTHEVSLPTVPRSPHRCLRQCWPTCRYMHAQWRIELCAAPVLTWTQSFSFCL